MRFKFTENSHEIQQSIVAIGCGVDKKLHGKALELDKKTDGAITKVLSHCDLDTGCSIFIPVNVDRLEGILLISLGDPKGCCTHIPKIGAAIYKTCAKFKSASVDVMIEGLNDDLAAAKMAYGMLIKEYKFSMHTKKTNTFVMENVVFHCEKADVNLKAFEEFERIAYGMNTARDLINKPANIIYPASFVEEAQKLFVDQDVQITVLDEQKMHTLGMHALLGVGKGSTRESKLLIVEWRGASEETPFLSLVGKGVTFDTGGISLKPPKDMHEMKCDVSGGAAILGAIYAIAARKARVNIVGLIGLVENMPDGNAQRPGDVVTSLSGQTIEVLNTDAEGRLVLADVLWYAQEKFNPSHIVDIATLTGSARVTFGTVYGAVLSNDDALAGELIEAGSSTGDLLWRLPMHCLYDKQIDSEVADVQNIGRESGADTITAAHFLKRFIKKGTRWAHIDMAPVSYRKTAGLLKEHGATGFGVALFDRWVRNYENDMGVWGSSSSCDIKCK